MMELKMGTLSQDGISLLTGLAPEWSAEIVPEGAFLSGPFAKRASACLVPLGKIERADRFAASVRFENIPWWTHPESGRVADKPLPPLAYWVLYRHLPQADGRVPLTLLVPLPTDREAVSLQSTGGASTADVLSLLAETGDTSLPVQGGRCLFVSHGTDLDTLLEKSARAISKALPGARLRGRKPAPVILDKFGWCTWNAFYQTVDREKVLEGLQSFSADGTPPPRFLVLDDGWLDTAPLPCGGDVLKGFEANGRKFPGGLKAFAADVRAASRIDEILVWHAVHGYWRGISPTEPAMRRYRPRPVSMAGDANMKRSSFTWLEGCDQTYLPAIEKLRSFYMDFHRFLQESGISGVKVDNQSSFLYQSNAYAPGKGRTAHAKAFRRALSASAKACFSGCLISCMCDAPEILYEARYDNLARSSDDFFPDRPASHAAHLRANAYFSLWFGQFSWMDWDMFASGHPYGPYHAAGRVLSGGPVYVADAPREHDAGLLRKVVFPDGSVVRCDAPARPALRSLFGDWQKTKEPLVLVNTFLKGQYGVAGIFQAEPGEAAEAAFRSGCQAVRASDLPGKSGKRRGAWAVWAHGSKLLRVLAKPEKEMGPFDVRGIAERCPLGCELLTFAPVVGGLAIVGIEEMLFAAAPIAQVGHSAAGVSARFRMGGTLVAYARKKPSGVFFEDRPVPFGYDPETGRIDCTIPDSGMLRIQA